ncbi:MAG: pyridoxine 5'-phosphate synthase [Candidatus Omnitrophica bacterium]|nr:pyridoxine 5'-phosphate synthase [Candidatus Omnitrophota bacterium]
MTRLGINIDHVATLRQARGGMTPDPVEAALVCQAAGADSIVAHLREDRRHIQDDDIRRLKKKLTVPLNMEMSIAEEIVDVAIEVQPDAVTLVPEHRREKTTESGIDISGAGPRLVDAVRRLTSAGIGVSLFVDACPESIRSAAELGVGAIEIHTGPYADAASKEERSKRLEEIRFATALAGELGILAHAGHGLDYENVVPLTKIPGIVEYNIGFSVVTRAVFLGLEQSVIEMIRLVRGASPQDIK